MAQPFAPLFQHIRKLHQRQNFAAILCHPAHAAPFHLGRRELFQAGQSVKRHGHMSIVGPSEEQEGLFVFLRARRSKKHFGGFVIVRFVHHVRALRQPHHVQNERNLAVPHDARAGKCLDLELLSQRFYDDFLRVVDFVHHQPELASVGLQYNNVDRFLFSLFVPARIRHFQFAPQIDQRQKLPSQPVNGNTMH